MKLNRRHLALFFNAALVQAIFCSARAADRASNGKQPDASSFDHLFKQGQLEGALTSGVLFSPIVITHNRPTINYTLTGVQLGYMLSDVKGDGWWRGNFELAFEGLASAVLEGPGGYIAGESLWLRYNFVPQGKLAIVPYAQIGDGVLLSDINHGTIGDPLNFTLGLIVGMRCFVTTNVALSLECRYQHITDANVFKYSPGINAVGPMLGISYFF